MLAEKYIHCSANWNSVIRDSRGIISGAVKPAKLVTFTNRPDDRWQRTVYDMDGNKYGNNTCGLSASIIGAGCLSGKTFAQHRHA